LDVRAARREPRHAEDLLDGPSWDEIVREVTACKATRDDLVDPITRNSTRRALADHGFFKSGHPPVSIGLKVLLESLRAACSSSRAIPPAT